MNVLMESVTSWVNSINDFMVATSSAWASAKNLFKSAGLTVLPFLSLFRSLNTMYGMSTTLSIIYLLHKVTLFSIYRL